MKGFQAPGEASGPRKRKFSTSKQPKCLPNPKHCKKGTDMFREMFSLEGLRLLLCEFENPSVKGIDRPFGEGVKSRLIRSLLINWRLGNFFFSF
jgi:hypothetical protein